MDTETPDIQLTKYSHGAGCGCKISPKVLDQILHTDLKQNLFSGLLVGNEGRDDAAVFDLGNGTAVISTTDFFMPIVDDPNDFGRIAAANAISDVFAMGGTPLVAVAILGWPINKLSPDLARQVLEGGRSVCTQAGIPLAGGHSIDSPEPIFGLAVTGTIPVAHLKQNNTARAGDFLFLTKPLGVGALSTAQKRGVLKEEHLDAMIKSMTTLNAIGRKLGEIPGVTAMTDVTGFGLLGHLSEMAEGSRLSASLFFDKIPALAGAREYIAQKICPGATGRNRESYGEKVTFSSGFDQTQASDLLTDPQTNGGLLFSVSGDSVAEVQEVLKNEGYSNFTAPIGRMTERGEKLITVLAKE